MTVQSTGTNKKIWRIGLADDEGKVSEELVFRVQGIIAKVGLQPGNVAK
jgi:hypothetical protein